MSNRTTAYVIIILLAGVLAAAWYFLSNPALPNPSTTYVYPEIEHKKPVCPGDTIAFFQSSHVQYVPASVLLVETVVNFDTGRTVMPDPDPIWYNQYRKGMQSGNVEWTVPDLPPGHYELQRATTPFGRTTAMYVVYFTVKEGC